MPKKAVLTTKPSEPEAVDAYMQKLKHPMAAVLEALRQVILKADPSIGEEIKWNAPTFFYSGEMKPFNPKEYKRYLVVSNIFKSDCIRLVFWGGDRAKDTTGFLEGEYADGRRLASFYSLADVKKKKKVLQAVLREQLRTMEK
jgi:hypothetical protein